MRDRASYVLDQNDIRLVVTSGLRPDSDITRFACEHGDGVKDVALTVPSATEAYRQAVQRGARSVTEPHWVEDDYGRVELASIATYGDNIHTFVNRDDYAGPYLPGYASSVDNGSPTTGIGLQNLDHVVGNVELGRMNHWVEFYERAFGMTELIHFSDEAISTEYSALMSKVMMDGEGKIKFPINEPAEGKRKSQIEEYLDFYGGPGVQHVAMATDDIVATVEELESRGLRFLKTPTAYYDDLEDRVGEIDADYDDLQAARHPRRPRRGGVPAPDLHEDGPGPADALLRGDRAARLTGVWRRQLQGIVRGNRARAGPPGQSLTRGDTSWA